MGVEIERKRPTEQRDKKEAERDWGEGGGYIQETT